MHARCNFFLLSLTKLLLLFGNITGLSQTIKGICHSGNLSNIICCRNFEFVDNSCIECEVGYHTFKAGTKCESCPQNLYGQKCAFICNCKENDRCDNKNGACIPLTTSVITLSEHSTVRQYQNQSTTKKSHRGFDANQAKYVAVVSELTDTNSIEPTETASVKESTGFERQRIIYIVIGGAMTVFFIACFSFLYAFYRKRKGMSMIESMPLAGQNPPQSATVPDVDVIEMNMLDHDYEEIDETNMINASLNIDNTPHESETDSNSGSTISPTEDDEGYLHPYHSLVHLKMMTNFEVDAHHSHSATFLRSNALLQNPYDHLQIPIKIPTTSGFESMEITDGSPTNSNKSGQEHAIENTVDLSCSLEDTNIRIYAEVERKNLPAQQDQIDRLS